MMFDKGSGSGEPPSTESAERQRATLTRQEIALALYHRLGNISHREAKRLTDCVIDEMVDTLTSGETLKLHDFGSFVVRSKHERAGRNPRTGDPVPIQARKVVVFKASPNMKAVVNGQPPSVEKPARRRKAPKDGSGGAARSPGSRTRRSAPRESTHKLSEATFG